MLLKTITCLILVALLLLSIKFFVNGIDVPEIDIDSMKKKCEDRNLILDYGLIMIPSDDGWIYIPEFKCIKEND
jgi:hypothetical protein